MNEKQAVQRLKQGDIGGLEYLVAMHQVRAVRASYLITWDVQLAEEIVQETFLQVYRSINGFDGNRPFEPWFMRSVVNASVKAVKKSVRQVNVDDVDESVFVEIVRKVEPVELQVENIELQN